jgi:hypothetical protein
MARPADATDVVNLSFAKIGSEAIADLATDTSARGLLAARLYDQVLTEMLRMKPWAFAAKRAVLEADDVATHPDYAYAYALPDDCVRVLGISGLPEAEYLLEAGVLYANMDLAEDGDGELLYTSLEEDVTAWDPQFLRALVVRLAYELSFKITAKMDLARQLYAEWSIAISDAGLENTRERFRPAVRLWGAKP